MLLEKFIYQTKTKGLLLPLRLQVLGKLRSQKMCPDDRVDKIKTFVNIKLVSRHTKVQALVLYTYAFIHVLN